MSSLDQELAPGRRLAGIGVLINAVLAVVKGVAGILGNSYALVADAVESVTDIAGSLVVWSGLRLSSRAADDDHPYGHGKAEPLAAAAVGLMLVGAAIGIAIAAVRDILTPNDPPAPFTLAVLVGVVVVKGFLFRRTARAARQTGSGAVKAEAWHHRSDALTSAAAFVGILIALLGGPGYEAADDWAALAACGVIVWNGLRLLRAALDEVMDASVSPETVARVKAIAAAVEGVVGIEKCRIRKVGLHLGLDIHVVVDGELSVRRGHDIAHQVKDRLLSSPHRINDVTVHIEPNP